MINKKVLVICAHPDDELLGCGGTLIKLKSKNKIKVIFFSDGESSRNLKKKQIQKLILKRKNQAFKVSKKLNFSKPEFVNLDDNRLDKYDLLHIIKIIENKIKKFKPDVIFTHSQSDLNIDHQIISRAVTTATRPNTKTFVKKIICFETPSSTEINFLRRKKIFNPNFFFDIGSEINKKIKLLKIYKGEIKTSPSLRSLQGIRILAKYRGSQIGVKYAEAFELIRVLKK